MRRSRVLVALLPLLIGVATTHCDAGGPASGGDSSCRVNCPPGGAAEGESVTTTISAARQKELDALQAQLDEVKSLDAAGFAAKYNVPFNNGPVPYDPLAAKGMDLIQASALSLDDPEKASLAANGFVITSKAQYPSFIYGFQTIYAQDLPVYVSADSILYAIHTSFDTILKAVERSAFVPRLTSIFGAMRLALQSGAGSDLPAEARKDVDVYLAVANALVNGSGSSTVVAGGDQALANNLVSLAKAASGHQDVTLFGASRDVDFSQFAPRGHYVDDPTLSNYFRAIMWLGRIELRLLETQKDHSQVFRRRSVESAFVLRSLMDATTRSAFDTLDSAIGAFVGEHDDMTLGQLDSLAADLKITNGADLAKLSDQQIAQTIVNGSYGSQRISSQLMVNGLGTGTMPLSSVFNLLGQRYVIDSHVFSNVVYDRVGHGSIYRMMPDPLDAAFAALHNNQAGMLLKPELEKFGYAPDLASMRVLADNHPADFWSGNLYNEWLTILQSLSPSQTPTPGASGLPFVATTEPWGRRILSTQLASWAELRHDTILYAKQSYTGGAACEYPDAYVEPYPEFFAKVEAFAARGIDLLGPLDADVPRPGRTGIREYFTRLQSTAVTLGAMAKNQRTGAPHSAEQLAFMNKLTFQSGCTGLSSFDGWYAKLFFEMETAIQMQPTIADVHTQYTDPAGNDVGRVLHVGTGGARLMVVTVESCQGPRAYAGLASRYHEVITDNYVRLNDQDWTQQLFKTPPADVPWMNSLVVH